jgi:hypothetical protein
MAADEGQLGHLWSPERTARRDAGGGPASAARVPRVGRAILRHGFNDLVMLE